MLAFNRKAGITAEPRWTSEQGVAAGVVTLGALAPKVTDGGQAESFAAVTGSASML